MKIYIDICCLKRAFEDQTQGRIALESAAMLSILRDCERGVLTAVRSSAHDLENAFDPDPRRTESVEDWLAGLNPLSLSSEELRNRVSQFRGAGISAFDALQHAWACELQVDVFLTTDDRFITRARRLTVARLPRIMNPVAFVEGRSS